METKKTVAKTKAGGRSARGDQNRSASRSDFYQSVAEILRAARANAYRAVNFAMVEAYWNVGRMIVEEDQRGKERAEYGVALLKNLSIRLSEEFGAGFSEQSLRNMRQFFSSFSIRSALRSELTWTHYKTLIRVENEAARTYYATEAANQNWTVRALERQINSLYYERLLLSRDRAPVIEDMQAQTAPLAPAPRDFIKDPYVLEFLGIPDAPEFREADLERAIISKLQAFMLELGKGFAFVARQKRIGTETKDFYIDLVFYNYILKCFVLVDLKTGELTHQDIGQMDMVCAPVRGHGERRGRQPCRGAYSLHREGPYRRQVFGAERKPSAFCIQVPALPAQRGRIACRDRARTGTCGAGAGGAVWG